MFSGWRYCFRQSACSFCRLLVPVILLQIFLPHLLGVPRNYPSETYTVEDGLIHNSVLWIEKDRFGFLWVFTFNGLCRFDGTNFKQYRPREIDSLSFTPFSRLISDPNGELWFVNSDGHSSRYDFRQDLFQTPIGFSTRGTLGEFPFRASNGDLWKYDSHSVSKLIEHPDRSVAIESKTIAWKELGEISGMYEFPEGELWLNASSGLYLISDLPEGIALTRCKVDIKGLEGKPHRISRIIPCGNRFWLHADYRIMLINVPIPADRQEVRTIEGEMIYLENADIELKRDHDIYAMAWDPDGYLYFRTMNGVYQYAPDTKDVIRIYKEAYGQLDGGEGSFQLAMFYDRQGILWMGTGQGLVKIVTGHKGFHIIHPDPGGQENSKHLKTNAVLLDQRNHLWIGTVGDGLYRGIPDQYGNHQQFDHFLPDPADPFSLQWTGVCAIYEDSRGAIWINGNRIDLSEPTPRFLSVPYSHLIGQIGEDSEGNIVVSSTTNGCHVFHPDSGQIYLLSPEENFPEYNYSGFYITEAGQLFLETYNALYQLNGPFRYTFKTGGVPGQTTGFSATPEDTELIPVAIPESNIKLLDIVGGSVGRFIVTEHEGYQEIWLFLKTESSLKRYRWQGKDPAGKESGRATGDGLTLVKTYSVTNGLSDEFIFDLVEDNRQRIWCSTTNGLTCIDPETDQIFRYYEEDGLPADKFYWGVEKDPEGNIYFCTIDGVVYFDPDQIVQDPPPPVYIHGFRLFNVPVIPGPDAPLKEEVMFADRLTLPYHQNFISLEFTALDFRNPGKVRYQYKMEGLDRDWVEAGNRRIVDYPNMRPGQYTFRVRASNGNGIWNREGASIDLQIKHPPWRMWWAYLIYGVILASMVLWYRNFLLNRAKIRVNLEMERMEKEKIRELDHMKSRFFANISHEFRTPLTLLLGPVEDGLRSQKQVIETKRDLFIMMKRNAKRLQRLIDQLLSLSRLETGKMSLRVRKDDMVSFIINIALSFTSLAESRRIRYELDLPSSFSDTYFDPDKLEKILTNLIFNAFKFTPTGGRIGIQMQFQHAPEDQLPETVEIKVSDSGKGIPKEQIHLIFERFYQVSDSDTREYEGSGIGLALSKELVEVYRGTLDVESEIGKGTVFTLSLPVSEGLFRSDEITVTENETAEKTKDSVSEALSEVSSVFNLQVAHPDEKPGEGPVVLIVEDNEDLRNYISRSLEDQYRILVADHGATGLSTAFEQVPDLIISDLMMPEMSGLKMTEKLKKDGRTNHIPVIILTAKADRRSKLDGLEIGADDYIIKPFDAEELKVRVRNLIDQRARLRENFRWQFLSGTNEQLPASNQDQLLQKILEILIRHANEPDFNLKKMAWELGMSSRQLFRKVQALTGYTPNHLLRNIRLKKAAALFDRGMDNITEVMYEVGFTHHSYFSKCFRELYQVNPSDYIRRRAKSPTN
jgi:signal transduction histidine kinase/DNA-binding response OmpR family regulator/streptogramin lyase